MNLHQQIIESEVTKTETKLEVPKDIAFLRFTHSLITSSGLNEFNETDLVDGGQDKQIDAITIVEDDEYATVFIVQAKYSETFSSNSLIHMHNGLSWVFHKSKNEVNQLTNDKLKDKIREYRSVQSEYGPSSLNIVVRFVTNGDEKDISDEFKQELDSIKLGYGNGVFNNFSVEGIGSNTLVELIKRNEVAKKKIDVDLKMVYDANNPSIVKYHSGELKGLVASIPGSEIARIVNEDKYGYIFDWNIRRFLGKKGPVNAEIHETATGTNSHLFWYLNNGITIICDHFDAVTDPDNPLIKIRNVQIVNGCQTATTLAAAQSSSELKENVRVQTKIYQSEDANLVSNIVLTTNNQNKINNRNLRSNDDIQKDLKKRFEQLGYSYERSHREFEYSKTRVDNIVSNEIVGQSYLAIVVKKPSDARGRKYKIWSDHYKDVFKRNIVEPYILCFKIVTFVEKTVKEKKLKDSKDDMNRMIAKNGTFHISRVFTFIFRGNDSWNKAASVIKEEIAKLESEDNSKTVDRSVKILSDILKSKTKYTEDPINAFKSYDLDEDITKYLYTMKMK